MPTINSDLFGEHIDLSDDDLLIVWDSANAATKKLRLSTLKAFVSVGTSGGGTGGTTTGSRQDLVYSSDGDTNGVFYWIGTNKLTEAWSNPHTAGRIIVSQSSAYSSNHAVVGNLVDRQLNDNPCTANLANSFFEIDLLANKNLILSGYSLRARNFATNHPRGWNWLASNDYSNWITIDTKTNINLVQNQWFTQLVSGQTQPYRWFHLQFNQLSSGGDNITCLGEIELYGSLLWS